MKQAMEGAEKRESLGAVHWFFFSVLCLSLAGCSLLSGSRGPLEKSSYQLYREERQLERNTQALTHFSYAQHLVMDGRAEQAEPELKAALAADPDSAYLREVLAYVLYQQGKTDEARAWARDSIKYGPDRDTAHFLLGAILIEDKSFAEAEAAFFNAHELDPKNPDYVIGLADARLRQGKVDEALAALEGFSEKRPEEFLVRYYVGAIYMNEGQDDRAAQVFRSILASYPSFYPALSDLFRLELERKDWEAAVQVGRAIVEYYPGDSETRLTLSDLLIRTGREDEALRVLENGKTQGGLDPVWWAEKGFIYLRADKLVEAREEFELALALDPKSVAAVYGLGLVEMEEGDAVEAAALFESVPKDSRFYVYARKSLALIALREDQPERAVMIMEKIYGRNSDDMAAALSYSWALREAGKYDQAQQVVETALKKWPDQEELLLELALIHGQQGETDRALALMEEYLKTHPDSAPALNFIGYTLAEEGRELTRAEVLIRRALELEPGAGYIMDSLGWVYYQKGEYSEALEWLLKALAAAGEDPEILEHIGDCQLARGQKREAREAYQKALENASSVEQRKRLRNKLKEL